MKRLLLINEVCGHTSTGKICGDIAEKYDQDGWKVKTAFGRDGFVPEKYKKYALRITNDTDVKIAAVESRLFDNAGFSNRKGTEKFIRWIDKFKPDLIWIHNLHGYYINAPILFGYLKQHPEIEKRWTLHDCWAFTGHCVYFTMAHCDKWKTHCEHCPQRSTYPKSLLLDRSFQNYDKKRTAFTGIQKLTIVTPSKWLAGLVKQSFLKEYPVEVVYNTIDTSVFRPTEGDFREKYGLEKKFIILGVSNAWQEPRKGLKDFFKLMELLDDRYAIVLVGVSEDMKKSLPAGIIGITKTSNVKDLAEIYTAADVLVNPTYEDNYPTVNLEAEACGTPVITYRTGGSPESVPEENVVEVGDVKALAMHISQINSQG